MAERIGFISTRFSGTDGVSLESAKWAKVFWDYGHISYWYAGELDRADDVSLCIPEAHFRHPENLWINERIWGRETRDPLVNRRIMDMAAYLKSSLYAFMQKFDISIFVIENCLSIPMHLPLGIAITEFLSETGMPSIAHHHDFYWERTRFSVGSVSAWLDMAFPPRTPSMRHVVINLAAQEEMAWRKGLTSLLIPNVLDFENPPPAPDAYASSVREDIGLAPGDVMILQPTRVVPRKGIEHAIKLVEMLGDPKYKLVISHKAGDEGLEYCQMLSEMAREEGVDLRFVETRVGDSRQVDFQGKKIYTLWDLYSGADLITYPSLYEGFGNAFLEAIYFRKPVLINRYAIFGRDVEPKGFRVPVMDGYLTKGVARELRKILQDDEYRRQMVEHNYQVATRFYSYSVLRRSLRTLITDIRGLD